MSGFSNLKIHLKNTSPHTKSHSQILHKLFHVVTNYTNTGAHGGHSHSTHHEFSWMCAIVHACLWGSEGNLRCPLSDFPLASLIGLEFANCVRLAMQKVPRISLPRPSWPWEVRSIPTHSAFLHEFWGFNSCPQSCVDISLA